MTEDEAVLHIKKQYQKMFMQREKAQEFFDYITDNGDNINVFKDRFDVQKVDAFINNVVSDLNNNELYGFIKIK